MTNDSTSTHVISWEQWKRHPLLVSVPDAALLSLGINPDFTPAEAACTRVTNHYRQHNSMPSLAIEDIRVLTSALDLTQPPGSRFLDEWQQLGTPIEQNFVAELSTRIEYLLRGRPRISVLELALAAVKLGWPIPHRLAENAGVPRPLEPPDVAIIMTFELWSTKNTAFYLAGYAPLPQRNLIPKNLPSTIRELQRKIGDAVDTGSLASYGDGEKVRPMDVAAWAKTRGCCPAWLARRVKEEASKEFKPGMKKSAVAVAEALAQKAGCEPMGDINKWNTGTLLQFIIKVAPNAKVPLARGAPQRIAQLLAEQGREPIAERTLQEILLRVHSLDPTSE